MSERAGFLGCDSCASFRDDTIAHVVFNPGWFINDLDGLSVAVVHGSPWRYDTYVPILFAGYGSEAQTVSRRVHTGDVAITLATAVGTRPPSGAAGEVLLEVLGQEP